MRTEAPDADTGVYMYRAKAAGLSGLSQNGGVAAAGREIDAGGDSDDGDSVFGAKPNVPLAGLRHDHWLPAAL